MSDSPQDEIPPADPAWFGSDPPLPVPPSARPGEAIGGSAAGRLSPPQG
jgi:hypothetical protein